MKIKKLDWIQDIEISKDWDCTYTLEELIEKCTNGLCLITGNFIKNEYDDCYGRFLLFFPIDDENYVHLGVKEDGLIYLADSNLNGINSTSFIEIEHGLKFMMYYKNFMNAKCNLECKLAEIYNEDCINIIFDNGYETQYRFNKNLTFK